MSLANFMLCMEHYERGLATARREQAVKEERIASVKESLAHTKKYGAHPLWIRDLNDKLKALTE